MSQFEQLEPDLFLITFVILALVGLLDVMLLWDFSTRYQVYDSVWTFSADGIRFHPHLLISVGGYSV